MWHCPLFDSLILRCYAVIWVARNDSTASYSYHSCFILPRPPQPSSGHIGSSEHSIYSNEAANCVETRLRLHPESVTSSGPRRSSVWTEPNKLGQTRHQPGDVINTSLMSGIGRRSEAAAVLIDSAHEKLWEICIHRYISIYITFVKRLLLISSWQPDWRPPYKSALVEGSHRAWDYYNVWISNTNNGLLKPESLRDAYKSITANLWR